MVAFGELRHSYTGPHAYCAYFGRRDHRQYLHSHDEIMTLYGAHMHMVGRDARRPLRCHGQSGLYCMF